MARVTALLLVLITSGSLHAGELLTEDIVVYDDDAYRISITERYPDNRSPLKVEFYGKRQARVLGVHDGVCDLGRLEACKVYTKVFWNSDRSLVALSGQGVSFYEVRNNDSKLIDLQVIWEKEKEFIGLDRLQYRQGMKFVRWESANSCSVELWGREGTLDNQRYFVLKAILKFEKDGQTTRMSVPHIERKPDQQP